MSYHYGSFAHLISLDTLNIGESDLTPQFILLLLDFLTRFLNKIDINCCMQKKDYHI